MSLSLPWPTITNPDGSLNAQALQENFDKLASAGYGVGGSKDLEDRFGSTTVTFTAAQNSAPTTVTHGLGRVPVAIEFGGADAAVKWAWQNKTATTFQIIGRHEAVVTGTAVVDWRASG
jgi:hypothetical protein